MQQELYTEHCSVPQFLAVFEEYLNDILPNFDFVICGGDLNIDLLKIESCGAKLLLNILRALVKYKKTNERHQWEYYKTLRNETNYAVKREKKAYLEYQMRTKNKKTLWKDLRDLSILPKNH